MGTYSQTQLKAATIRILDVINERIAIASATGTLDSLLEELGIDINDQTPPQIISRNMKILVLGGLSGRQSDYEMVAKKLNIPPDNLEFIEFDKFKSFSLANLYYSTKYSDIIVGPIPHKGKDLEGTSLIAMIENASDKAAYPRLYKAIPNTEGGSLKLTISDFKKGLLQSKLIVAFNDPNIY